MSLPLVEARGLTRRLGRIPVLDGADLLISPGEVVALLGENGAGKTTLLRILAGLERAEAGSLRIAGMDPAEAGARARRAIGYAGHAPGLYEALTVEENLRFFARFYPDAPPAWESAVEIFGLEAFLGRRVARLSRGERQRVALARAFAHAPRVLLFDEPFTGLDAGGADALLYAMRNAARSGSAVLFSTHERGLPLADRVVRLAGGRLHATERAAGVIP